MPYSTLTEREVVEQLKANFLAQEDLKSQKDYKYFYEALPGWSERSIVSSRDKLVQTAVFSFRARIVGRGGQKVGMKKKEAVIEQAVEFTVSVCNDKAFIKVHGDQYLYCEQAGADIVEGPQAESVCQAAARQLYVGQLAEKGYIYESCVMEDWDYVSRETETYTEYAVEYDCLGETKLIHAIVSGENFIYYTAPVPKRKKSHLGAIIGTILAVAVVAAVVVFLVLYFK